MWQAAPLMMGDFATYSPSSAREMFSLGRVTFVGDRTKLTNKDRPYVDENEKRNVGKLLKRKNVGVYVIGHALRKSVQGMEGVARKRGWHNPFMMWFMESLVNQRMMQAPVYPVYEEVCKSDEEWEL